MSTGDELPRLPAELDDAPDIEVEPVQAERAEIILRRLELEAAARFAAEHPPLPPPAPEPPPLPRGSFSLRQLLMVMTVVAIGLGLFSSRIMLFVAGMLLLAGIWLSASEDAYPRYRPRSGESNSRVVWWSLLCAYLVGCLGLLLRGWLGR